MKEKVLLVTVALLVGSLVGCAAPTAAPTAPTAATAAPSADLEPILWRFGSNYSSAGVKSEAYRRFADIVEVTSDGRLKIEMYWDASLGFKNSEALVAFQSGLVEITEVIGGSNTGSEPFDALICMPFLFPDALVYNAWRANTAYPKYNEILEKRGWNAKVMGDKHNPPILFFSKEPLTKTEDFKGLSVRTWGGPVSDSLAVVGCQPFVISTAEIFEALHRGMIDASITTYVSATETHFWEVLNYVNMMPIAQGQDAIAVRLDAYNKLPADLREVADQAFLDLEAHNCRTWVYQAEMLQMLLDGGMEVVYPDAEVAISMRATLVENQFYKKFADAAGPEGVELMKALGAY